MSNIVDELESNEVAEHIIYLCSFKDLTPTYDVIQASNGVEIESSIFRQMKKHLIAMIDELSIYELNKIIFDNWNNDAIKLKKWWFNHLKDTAKKQNEFVGMLKYNTNITEEECDLLREHLRKAKNAN